MKNHQIFKIVSLVLAIITAFCAWEAIDISKNGDAGPDGLSTFFPIVLFGILTLVCFALFLGSLFLLKEIGVFKKWLLAFVVAIPVLQLGYETGLFGSNNTHFEVESQADLKARVKEANAALETIHFINTDFGVAFDYISEISHNRGDSKSFQTVIIPKIENTMLVVPVDEDNFRDPDVLFKFETDTVQELPHFLQDLGTKLRLVNFELNEVPGRTFPKLLASTEVMAATSPKFTPEERLRIAQHFLPGRSQEPHSFYFLRSQEKPKIIWVLIISEPTNSLPATVEKLGASQFETNNLWFHTLEFVD